MIENKTINFRHDFPGYMGHIPYKKEVIGRTVGSSNNFIKNTLTTEPAKEEIFEPIRIDDYSNYNKDYFSKNFSKNYNLEEDKIYSDKSKEAETWINGSKYKIYPQHVPGYKAHVPGIYSSNIHGMGYSKSTAIAIKGEYIKNHNLSNDDRFESLNSAVYKKPQMRSREEEENNKVSTKDFERVKFVDPSSMKTNATVIFKSKIANVPTPGYSGHQSIFIKPISYLNKDDIDIGESQNKTEKSNDNLDLISDSFKTTLKPNKSENGELPYIVGYKGFRPHVRAKNYYGNNFTHTSLTTRNKK